MQEMRQSQDHRCTHSLHSVVKGLVGQGDQILNIFFPHLQDRGETTIATIFTV